MGDGGTTVTCWEEGQQVVVERCFCCDRHHVHSHHLWHLAGIVILDYSMFSFLLIFYYKYFIDLLEYTIESCSMYYLYSEKKMSNHYVKNPHFTEKSIHCRLIYV